MKGDEDKQKVISKHIVLTYSGEPGEHATLPGPCANGLTSRVDVFTGDTVQFAEYVERNLRLYGLRCAPRSTGKRWLNDWGRNYVELLPASAAAWTRNQLATSLRSRNPYSVNVLMGGFDVAKSAPALYWIDYLGTLATVPYAAHGYGSYFCLSTMDRFHTPDMDLDQGLALLQRCIEELEKRFIVNLGGTSPVALPRCAEH